MNSAIKPFCFLDRDGTINIDRHYLSDPSGLELLPGASQGLSQIAALGYRLVIVTNQSGVGRGYFTAEAAARVNARLVSMLAEKHIEIQAVLNCFHAPEEGCDCRKPGRALVDQAIAQLGGGLAGAIVIGDKDIDIGLATNIGARSILIAADRSDIPDYGQTATASDLTEAAAIVRGWKSAKG